MDASPSAELKKSGYQQRLLQRLTSGNCYSTSRSAVKDVVPTDLFI
jgi:hypothetical protein